jgi:hypothetical protein
VWLRHTQVKFLHTECNSHTQNAISKNMTSVLSTRKVGLQHAQVRFIHAKCNFNTNKCDYDTHKLSSYTQSAIHIRKMRFQKTWLVYYLHAKWDYNTHKYDLYMQSVILTQTSVIMTHTSKISTRIVRFLHAKRNFYTQNVISSSTSVISTRKVWFQHAPFWCILAIQHTNEK